MYDIFIFWTERTVRINTGLVHKERFDFDSDPWFCSSGVLNSDFVTNSYDESWDSSCKKS